MFTALDPIENGNRYQYVDANPTNFADPSGLCIEEIGRQLDLCLPTQQNDIGPCWTLHNTIDSVYYEQLVQYQRFRNWNDIKSLIQACREAGGLSIPNEQLRRHYLWNYAEFLLDTLTNEGRDTARGYTDLEALALLADYASTFNLSGSELSNDITYVIVGPSATGAHTLASALVRRADGVGSTNRRDETGSPTFLDWGFHSDYQDHQNQLYHFWAYVNTTANGLSIITCDAGNLGAVEGVVGDFFHEVIGIGGGIGLDFAGSSLEDQRLAYMGMSFGIQLRCSGSVDVGNSLRQGLSSPYSGPGPNIPEEYWLPRVVESLREKLHKYGF